MQSRRGCPFLKLRFRLPVARAWDLQQAGSRCRRVETEFYHVETLDFAAPDPAGRFDGSAAGTTARFPRCRLYRRAALQPRLPGLYELVLPGAVGPATRGTRDRRRAGRAGVRTGPA